MRIKPSIALDFKDVLIVPKRSSISSRSEVDLVREFTFKHAKCSWSGIPIVSANMDTVTTPAVAKVFLKNKMLPIFHKSSKIVLKNSVQSIGLDYDTSLPLLTHIVCLDVANGGMKKFRLFIEKIRNLYPRIVIVAGNVATKDCTKDLIKAGADVVKIGLGSGTVCETRKITGIGVPQLTAVMECADAAHGLGAYIMSDGGCREPGDVCKAFAAGSDFVMLGGMLSGVDENSVEFYGLSSEKAINKFSGGLKNYRAAEGKSITVPSKGPLSFVLQDIMGGLRSSCSYVGAKNIEEFSAKSSFIRVSG